MSRAYCVPGHWAFRIARGYLYAANRRIADRQILRFRAHGVGDFAELRKKVGASQNRPLSAAMSDGGHAGGRAYSRTPCGYFYTDGRRITGRQIPPFRPQVSGDFAAVTDRCELIYIPPPTGAGLPAPRFPDTGESIDGLLLM